MDGSRGRGRMQDMRCTVRAITRAHAHALALGLWLDVDPLFVTAIIASRRLACTPASIPDTGEEQDIMQPFAMVNFGHSPSC